MIERDPRQSQVDELLRTDEESAIDQGVTKEGLQPLVDRMDSVIVVMDVDGTVLDAYDPFMRSLRPQRLEALIGSSVHQWAAPEHRERTRTALAECGNKGHSTDFETVYVARDGKHIHLMVTATAQESPDGTRIIALCRDISRLKKYQAIVHEATELSSSLLENSPAFFVALDGEGKVLRMNTNLLKSVGYEHNEVVGKDYLSTFVPLADRGSLASVFKRLSARHELTFNRNRILTRDGQELTVEWRGAPVLDTEGSFRYFYGIGIDVTEQRRAEEKQRENERLFRTIVESAHDWIFIKDTSFRYTLVNPAMAEALGVPASDIIGRTPDDFFSKNAAEQIRRVDRRVIAGESVEMENTRTVRGVPCTFIDIREPMRNSRGNIIGVLGISRDITGRTVGSSAPPPEETEYRSPAMNAALSAARLAAQSDSTTLIMGESGTGKDYMARYIHEQSKRSTGTFLSVNCAALPQELAESELFGHEAGAFTGAQRRKRGLLELAEGGTLLLNEIGDLPLPLQAKLLTFLDTHEITRVGGERSHRVNIRLMAATNKDLHKEVAEGRFRTDLYYRLNVLSIQVPPLRERTEDLPVLIERILSQLRAELQMPAVTRLSREAVEKLSRYHWPGNVRELKNTLERALIVSGGAITIDSLGPSLSELNTLTSATSAPDGNRSASSLLDNIRRPGKSMNDLVRQLKYQLVQEALTESGGKKQEASDLLGISRFTLNRLLQSFEEEPP
jgi:PAS domain S-box-containing protein